MTAKTKDKKRQRDEESCLFLSEEYRCEVEKHLNAIAPELSAAR